MADKLFEDSEFYAKRFSCKCLHPAHTVDLCVEVFRDVSEKDKKSLSVEFAEQYIGNQLPLLDRIKRAFRLLLGREVWGHGFYVRPEDIPEMIELLSKAMIIEEKDVS